MKFFLLLITVFILAHFIDRGKIMTPEITVPYFSGAAINDFSHEWKFNLTEVDSIKKIQDIKNNRERIKRLNDFHFSLHETPARTYNINQPGFRWMITAARFLFPCRGDIWSVKVLQLLLHVIFSYLILQCLKGRRNKIIFLLLYIFNPVIIYYALFPFYYFWQVIPSFILLLAFLSDKRQSIFIIVLTAFILAVIFQTRVTTLPVSVIIFLIGFRRINVIQRVSGLIFLFLFIWLLQPGYLSKHPGHVMYSSLGAYPGFDVKEFSDSVSFADYNKSTVNNYSYQSHPGLYDPEVIMGEARWGYQNFKLQIGTHPLLFARNIVLNVCESFSVGYVTGSLFLSYLSAFIGFIFFILLVKKKLLINILFIITSTAMYISYLAPVPIYLYGSYVFIILAFIQLINKLSVRTNTN